MRELFDLLETVATSTSTVLVTGETGTGKELAARAIHHNSPRTNHRFVALNCSAVPEALLESELFGHVRGAFTGAVSTRKGRLEDAHQGTLFLDEVGTMSGNLQAKLLRVLQERELERVGDNRTIKIDVRIIAATNADLSQLVSNGSFREDLYYRLNVIPIFLPPLRNRREDIPLLVQHFVRTLSPRQDRPREVSVTQEALRLMMGYDWPGNIRQLENAIERAFALGSDRTQIDGPDLPPELQIPLPSSPTLTTPVPEDGFDMPAYLAKTERELIQSALTTTDGNKQQAAQRLGLKRTTLVEKVKRLL
tara:strand:- start:10786 stop:11709 length:924 start_codon:yes stop_codon:yes gene_type:complete